MFKDKILNDTKIFQGDIVYIYQYQKRKEIEFFEDLNMVNVLDVVPRTKSCEPIMVSGFEKKCINGIIDENKILGIVQYVRDKDIIKTSEGNKIINYFVKDKKPILCLRKLKDEYDYCKLKAIFQLDKNLEIKVEPYDLICLNQDNLCDLIKLTKISHPRLHNGYISFLLNGEEVYINNFEIYINNKKYNNSDSIKEIFKWACENKNNINNATFDFQKIFSLKLTNYEMIPCKPI